MAFTIQAIQLIRTRLAEYAVLVKLRLTLLVVFSSVFGYFLGADVIQGSILLLVVVGGLFVTFAANSMNQVLEKDYDRLMKRTQNRPLVTGTISVSEAVLFSGISCVIGVVSLAAINMWAALFGMISFLLYAFVYTPLKRIHPIAVLVGAIPGAMPVFIGWVSGSGMLAQEGLLLFSLQFFWQFPHFWAIAWLGHEDYSRAGFKMLPEASGLPTRETARQSLIYASMLTILPILFYVFGFTSWLGLGILLLLGAYYTRAGYSFYRLLDDGSARRLLYASFLYLPMALIGLFVDQWLLG
ncbi:MAG: heme o synthase [Saprospiraceae bacterium]|nr:heme o synthase [Saprospiraceae bacterium]